MQIWPWCRNEPQAPAETARSRSASSSTISAELPPSSRCTRLRWRGGELGDPPAGRAGAGERDDPDAWSATSAGPPRHRRAARAAGPRGRPASANTRAIANPPLTGVRTSGLSTTALPSASAGATERIDRISGTLNGEITPTTPTGTRLQQAQPGLVALQDLAGRAVGQRRPPRSTPASRRRPRSRRGPAPRRSPGPPSRAARPRWPRSARRPGAAPRPAPRTRWPPTPAAPRRPAAAGPATSLGVGDAGAAERPAGRLLHDRRGAAVTAWSSRPCRPVPSHSSGSKNVMPVLLPQPVPWPSGSGRRPGRAAR